MVLWHVSHGFPTGSTNRWPTLLGGLAVLMAFAANAQTAPSPPTGLTAAPLDASASLTWTDPSDSTITGYSVRSAATTTQLASATWQAISGSGATTTSHTVASLTNGTRYYFQVRATNAQGDSAASNTATIQLAASPTTAVNIPDSALRTALEAATGKSSGQTITRLDMAKLTGTFSAVRLNISAVTGLEYAVNITTLELASNSITNVTALGSLTALTDLSLASNSIRDVTALGSLTSLTTLWLNGNAIRDVTALGSLTSLTTLWLNGNAISDVTALGSLTSLTWLRLSDNSITDVTALGGLTALTHLYLTGNSITDVTALGSLTSLKVLFLRNNQISDVTGLGSLPALTVLELQENQISDATALGSLVSLTNLRLSDNSISIVPPLGRLTSLAALWLHNNQITDATPLGRLTSLAALTLNGNQITDATPLGRLVSLTTLWLHNNQISDATPLASLTALTDLRLSDNSISNVTPLGSLVSLRTLWLHNNSISNATPLGSLVSLTTLSLYGNRIADATPLASLTALTWLSLSDNRISDATPLATLTSLTSLWLAGNPIDSLSDVPLASLGSLIGLGLGGRWITDSVLAALVAAKPSLTQVTLTDGSIENVSPLTGLTGVTWLDLSDNSISDATPLAPLASLANLRLGGNPIDSLSDVPLASLGSLIGLGLSGRWITDSVLAALVAAKPSLTQLVLTDGSIENVLPLARLAGVSLLDLNDNSISDISPLLSIFRSRPSYIDLRGNPLSVASLNRHIPDIRRRYYPWRLLFDAPPDSTDMGDSDETDDTPDTPPVGNQRPSVSGELPALELDVGETAAVALGAAFDDADGDPLRYAASAAGGFVSVRIDGSAAHVTGERPGEATVTVTAEDLGGLTATTSFQVAVGALLSVPASVVAQEGGTAVVAVELSRAMSSAVTVRWSLVADGDAATADADADDYGEAAGEVSIPAGETIASIEIAIADDMDIEPAREHFVVALEQPADGNIGLAADSRTAVAIREGVCDRTPAVRDELARGWRSCHWPKPAGLAKVRTLDLNGRGIAALRPNDLMGLRTLRRLDLSDNELAELPAGLFAGLARLGEVSLEGNPGAPFALAVELERMDAEPWMPGPARVAAKTAWGAPFALAAELEASPTGAANSLPATVDIAAGATAGQPFRVSSANGSALALHAEAASMPTTRCGERACFRGFELTRGSPLTLFRLPPRAMPMPEIEPLLGGELRLPVASLIEAAHALDELRWEATSSNAALATAHVVDGHLVVTPELASEGAVEITLVATDAAGLSTTVRLEVRVEFHWPRDPASGWRGAVLEGTASP